MVSRERYDDIEKNIISDVVIHFNNMKYDVDADNSRNIRASRAGRTYYSVEVTSDNVRHPHFGNIVVSFRLGWEIEKQIPRQNLPRVRSFKVDPSKYNRFDIVKKAERYAVKLAKDANQLIREKERAEVIEKQRADERARVIREAIDGVDGVEYEEDNDKITYRDRELVLGSWSNGLSFRVQLGRYRTMSVPLDKVIAMFDILGDDL